MRGVAHAISEKIVAILGRVCYNRKRGRKGFLRQCIRNTARLAAWFYDLGGAFLKLHHTLLPLAAILCAAVCIGGESASAQEASADPAVVTATTATEVTSHTPNCWKKLQTALGDTMTRTAFRLPEKYP